MGNPKAKQILLTAEADFGKDDATAKSFVLLVNENGIVGTDNTKTDNVIGGDIDSGGELYVTSTDTVGSIKSPMYYEQIGIFLKTFFGDEITTQNDEQKAKNVYSHTFKSNKCIKSFSVEDTLMTKCNKTGADKDIIKRFNGLMANTMAMQISPDGDYVIEVNYIGATAKDNLTDATLTAIDTANKISLNATRIKNAHAKLYIGDDLSDLTALEPYKLAKDFSLNLDRGTQSYKVLTYGAAVDDSKFDVSGSMSSLFDGEFYKKARANTKQQVKVVLQNGDYSLILFMPEVQFSFEDSARTYGETYPMNLKFSCSKTGLTEAKIEVVLNNKISSYGNNVQDKTKEALPAVP
ncbi:hypothetical protein YY92_08165 [Campylobacter fetus]|uniref:phage tail tube protein n=1 Tax=Campylobacter fetus TaxID=196 RepID=UPI0011C7E47D|nr:phage tail tube protein [Campylobacter fetus]EAJ1232637.1 hypothetical protein [Campylobacter fetus]EAK0414684.1 hypothetical protein [Campylobacter fetus]TXF09200.1 hypothetical protein FPD25_03440 [Campylobacter fetus subsp. fetus]